MSYSFNTRSKSKAEARVAVSAAFDKVVDGQPVHAKDRVQAQAAAFSYIDLLADEDRDVIANVYGSITYTDDGIRSVNVNVSVQNATRE